MWFKMVNRIISAVQNCDRLTDKNKNVLIETILDKYRELRETQRQYAQQTLNIKQEVE